MTKWYDRIGNTIQMYIEDEWIKGNIIKGERSFDGIINMKTSSGQTYWCGVNGEYIHFRKCNDSLGDLLTNTDKIRSMSNDELAKWLTKITDDAQLDANTKCNYQWDEWLKEEVEQS